MIAINSHLYEFIREVHHDCSLIILRDLHFLSIWKFRLFAFAREFRQRLGSWKRERVELKTFDFFVVLLLIFIQSLREFCLVYFLGRKLRKEGCGTVTRGLRKELLEFWPYVSRKHVAVGLLLAGRVPSSFWPSRQNGEKKSWNWVAGQTWIQNQWTKYPRTNRYPFFFVLW